MALNIKNPIAERLAQELAKETGESLTEAVIVALRDRLDARRRRQQRQRLLEAITELQIFVRAQPDRDLRSDDEVLGYDEHGIPR